MPRCSALTPLECPACSTDPGAAETTWRRNVAALSRHGVEDLQTARDAVRLETAKL